MTNTKMKGQKKETLAANILKSEGYEIVFKSRTVRQGPFFVGLDFADLFDIVAVRTHQMIGLESPALVPEWLFLSVKHEGSDTGGLTLHREAIRRFSKTYSCPGMGFQLWRWRKPGYHWRGKNRVFGRGEFLKESIL